MILGAGKCKAIPEIGYYYRTERENSITKNIKYSSLSDLLESISKNIEDIVKMDVSTELKGMLCNNFSCLYYAILIQSNCLQNKKEKELLWKNLDEKKWICKYTIEKKQKAVRMIMNWVGIPAAARLLNVRRILKNII